MSRLQSPFFHLLFFAVLLSCSQQKSEQAESEQTEQAEDYYMSAYDKDRYLIKPDGLGKFKLGSSIQELEEHIPIAEMSPIEGDGGVEAYLIRLAESDDWDLTADVVYDEVVAMTFHDANFYTEKQMRPEESRFSDLIKNYQVEYLYVPYSGTLHVMVSELPRVTFIFEAEELLQFNDESQPQVKEIPGTITLKSIYVAKALQ